MADTTDHPHGSESVSSPTEQRIATEPQPSAAPGGELGTLAPAATETYRPLSLLALAGFALAVLYALVVLVGAAVALFSRIPWLMPGWTFLLPLAALIVCWAARTRIRNSEDTLSGLAFTTWGSRLAVLVGITYAAYYAATFFAVRGQAADCANRFFEYLKKGEEDQAFLLSLGIPVKSTDSAELRTMLESRFNTPRGKPGSVGELSRFRQAQYVRSIETGGPKTNITLEGVSDWEYSKGGYRVVLRYRIDTPMVAFDLNLETFGRDSKPGEPKGRQWQVRLPSDAAIPPESRTTKPHGEEVVKKIRTAEQFASAWAAKVNQQQWNEAYRDTVLTSREELASGKLIRIDEKRFWAGKQQKEDIRRRVLNTFQPGSPSFMLSLMQAMPLVREEEGQTTVSFDISLRYLDPQAAREQYIVQGQLVVTAKEPDAASSASAWRVEALAIESGRTPPEEPARQIKR